MSCFPTNTQSKWFFRSDFHPSAPRANEILRELFRHGFEPPESLTLSHVLDLGWMLGLNYDPDDDGC